MERDLNRLSNIVSKHSGPWARDGEFASFLLEVHLDGPQEESALAQVSEKDGARILDIAGVQKTRQECRVSQGPSKARAIVARSATECLHHVRSVGVVADRRSSGINSGPSDPMRVLICSVRLCVSLRLLRPETVPDEPAPDTSE